MLSTVNLPLMAEDVVGKEDCDSESCFSSLINCNALSVSNLTTNTLSFSLKGVSF